MEHYRVALFLFLISLGTACSAQSTVTPPGSAVGTDASGGATQAPSELLKRPNKRVRPLDYSGPTTFGLDIPIMDIQAPCSSKTVSTITSIGEEWQCMFSTYYPESIFADIRNNLNALFVRTGWSYGEYLADGATTYNSAVDTIIGRACKHGLGTLLIIYPPSSVTPQSIENETIAVESALQEDETANPGCIFWTELDNEPNLLKDKAIHADLSLYEEWYENLAPTLTDELELPVITGGTSGFDSGNCPAPGPSGPPGDGQEICGKIWVYWLSQAFEPPSVRPPVDCYGFHPYDAVGEMVYAMQIMDGAPTGLPRPICVTEIGNSTASTLETIIGNLDTLTPLLSVYEYEQTDGETGNLWLVSYPDRTQTALYAAVQAAFATNESCGLPCGQAKRKARLVSPDP
jgi:hypothetical protein